MYFIKLSKTYIVDFDKIISARIECDDHVVSHKNIGSVVGASIVGGIIGASSVNTHYNKKSQCGSIVVNIKDFETPEIELILFAEADPIDPSDYVAFGNNIISLINVAIAEAKEQTERHLPFSVSLSVADEIKKLSELRSSNIITEEEFREQKRRLLNP